MTEDFRRIEALATGALGLASSALVLGPIANAVHIHVPWWARGIGAAVATANGVIVGSHAGYRWSRPEGWLAVILDSTWGLPNTAAGVALHVFARRRCHFRPDLSWRANRLVYEQEGGVAVSLGTCVKVMTGIEEPLFTQLLAHETFHTWQGRIAGPLLSITYPAWVVLSIVVGLLISPLVRQERMRTVTDLAVMDNPWELMAYWLRGPYPEEKMGGRLSLV